MIERLLEAERALSAGLLDQAQQLYQRAWEADPHNGIAVAGLARVALERGDEPAAHALVTRALAIDPDNLAAKRLVERLAEIQAARAGKPSEPPKATEPPPPPTSKGTRKPHVAPPAAIRTSGSGKGRTTPAPPGPTLPKARPLSPAKSASKPSPAAEPAAAAPAARARPAARKPAAPKPPKSDESTTKDKPRKQPGLLDRLFGPRR
jgi:tetratricopeptide (TPR) repeat protein